MSWHDVYHDPREQDDMKQMQREDMRECTKCGLPAIACKCEPWKGPPMPGEIPPNDDYDPTEPLPSDKDDCPPPPVKGT